MPYDIGTTLTAIDSGTPTRNLNYLAPAGFRLTLDKLKYPNVEYTVQTVILPDLSLPPAPVQSPMRRFGLPGDKIEYGQFELSFLVDEDMLNYREIHDWILEEIRVKDSKENKKTRDLTLSILSSHNNVTNQIQFVDAYPTTLSSLPFDITITDIQYLTSVVTFEYSYYKLL